jgi:hypothetical protein
MPGSWANSQLLWAGFSSTPGGRAIGGRAIDRSKKRSDGGKSPMKFPVDSSGKTCYQAHANDPLPLVNGEWENKNPGSECAGERQICDLQSL